MGTLKRRSRQFYHAILAITLLSSCGSAEASTSIEKASSTAATEPTQEAINVGSLRLPQTTTTSTTLAPQTTKVIGYSVKGKPITAYRLGTPGGKPVIAIAAIHGDEQGTVLVPWELMNMSIPEGLDVWVVLVANPDGFAVNRRQNENLVDLNRNFDNTDWRRRGRGTEKWSGEYAASEPETVALQEFILEIQPKVVVWWHQVNRMVDNNPGVANRSLLKLYSQLTGWPIRTANCAPMPCRGTATGFVNSHVQGSTSFVVELPSRVTTEMARSHAEAFLWVSIAA